MGLKRGEALGLVFSKIFHYYPHRVLFSAFQTLTENSIKENEEHDPAISSKI